MHSFPPCGLSEREIQLCRLYRGNGEFRSEVSRLEMKWKRIEWLNSYRSTVAREKLERTQPNKRYSEGYDESVAAFLLLGGLCTPIQPAGTAVFTYVAYNAWAARYYEYDKVTDEELREYARSDDPREYYHFFPEEYRRLSQGSSIGEAPSTPLLLSSTNAAENSDQPPSKNQLTAS